MMTSRAYALETSASAASGRLPAPACRLCGARLDTTFVDLGKSPLCESFLSAGQLDQTEPFYPLHVRICGQCLLAQLEAYVPASEIFADYALIPPFPQLGRKVHRLEPKELTTRGIVRNQGSKVPAVTLVGILERHGWNRGLPWAAGLVLAHSKPYEGANVTAVIRYDGVQLGEVDPVVVSEVLGTLAELASKGK